MATILVVDDDALVRLTNVLMVEDAGYDTVEAESAAQAIAILEARSDIHVLLTDVNMPGVDGVELAHYVRDRWPPLSCRRPWADGRF